MSRASDPFDTYLLRVFSTLMVERSVSRAAARLNQSQPAVSAALKKLRDILGDPLLIKDKQGMVPTERALQLEASVRIVLAEIDSLLAPAATFDPATTRQTFHIGMPDYLAPPLVASMVSYMRLTAPRVASGGAFPSGPTSTMKPRWPKASWMWSLATGRSRPSTCAWPSCWKTRWSAWWARPTPTPVAP
jgi:hypothetical protein